MRVPFRLRHLAVASLLALLVTGAVAVPASAAVPADAVVASGPGWTVERGPAGFVVTLALDTPLPVVSDAPTIVVDGQSIGVARISEDERTLTAVTSDPRVADARDVQKGWASGSGPKAGEVGADVDEQPVAPDVDNELLQRQLDALQNDAPIPDPGAPGPYGVTEAEYDFGGAAIDLAGSTGPRGEVEGKIYLSSAAGPRPVVVLLHGRHSSCGVVSTGKSDLKWPCEPGEMEIRSYLGYGGTGRALASHGYNVVSIAANAIGGTEDHFTIDDGARARGQLVLDTLGMLDRLTSGEPVSLEDRPTDAAPVTRSFDDALARAIERADQPAPASGLTAADLAGRFDLSRVGLMGHSRGGEGVVTAAQLNAAADVRYGILSVLPLAPADFARRTLPDVTTAVVLPYCDGDLSSQEGQHYLDDSRRAFDDDVLRSAVWVMGANHNFFNSVWTPGEYPVGAGDDWSPVDTTSACAASDPTRLTAPEQYQVGVSYMTGFFRLTLGREEQYLPLFDGSTASRTTATTFADVRIMATQPRSATDLVADFAGGQTQMSVSGDGTIASCESAEILNHDNPCTTVHYRRAVHWGLTRKATYIPSYPATRFSWSGPAGSTTPSDALLRVTVPEGARDASDREQLTVKTMPIDSVTRGTDFSLTLVDGSGGTWTVAASALNPYAVNRLPGGADDLDKTLLQQLTIPLSRVSGVDLSDVREVRFAPLIGADGTASGGVILSDLAFDSPSLGSPGVRARSSFNVAPTRADARDEPWDVSIAVYLDHPASTPVSAWVTVLRPRPYVKLVTFAPGQTCLQVPVRLLGEPGTDGASTMKLDMGITTGLQGVAGAQDFSTLLVRSEQATDVPPFGQPGNTCDELEASRTPGVLSLSSAQPRQGETVRVTGTGFRSGEGVELSFGSTKVPVVVAAADGSVAFDVLVPTDASPGPVTIAATGVGSARVQNADAEILAAQPTPSPTASPTPSGSATTTAGPAAAGGSSLAKTGVDGTLWAMTAVAGALLAAAGAGTVVRARRRRLR